MTRLDPFKAAPEQMQMLIDLSAAATKQSALEPKLQHLVKIRASQINGCALCLHMHIGEGRKDGETDTRMYLLDAWREAPIYTARERAALAWTETVTLIAETRAPDDVYADLKAHFTEAEMVSLTMLINIINSFNRLSVAFRRAPFGLVPIAEAA